MNSSRPHHHEAGMGDRLLALAVSVNILLTVVQVMGGIFSHSLSLVADALHNLSDAGALGLALFARRIARRPADEERTFGYGRAEIIGALINLTALILIGAYLVYEAVLRYFEPQPIQGWIVVIVAGIVLVIDLATAALTYSLSKRSLNVKAAFLHNVSDALASIGVIVAGTLIILYDLYIADAIVTVLIAGYVLYQGFRSLPRVIRILMQSTPPHINLTEVAAMMERVKGVENVHHLHIWEMDEHKASLEAHVIVTTRDVTAIEGIKETLKRRLESRFNIAHFTLEFEFTSAEGEAKCEEKTIISHH